MSCVDPKNHIRTNVLHAVVKNTHGYYTMRPPIGLILESKLPNSNMNAIKSQNMFGGITSSENIISIPSFDQLLQSVIRSTRTTKDRHLTKKRRRKPVRS
jgi:hypothetical protein